MRKYILAIMQCYIFHSKYYISKVLRNIFSIYKWVVFLRPIQDEELRISVKKIDQSSDLWWRSASSLDYECLVAVYPKEFSGTWPEKVKLQKLFARREKNIPCFVVGEGEKILGATWCVPVKEIPNNLFGDIQGDCFEMVNTFVVPEARKRGFGQRLRLYAISCMAEKGFRNAISFVWYSRRDSLKMNLLSGSLLVGEKRQTTVLGRQMKKFSPYVRLDRLPLASGMPTLVLVGYNFRRLKGIAKAFKKFGIPVKPVALQSSVSAYRWSFAKPRYSVKVAVNILQRLNTEESGRVIVLYADVLETAHVQELEKAVASLAHPLNSSSAIPDLGAIVLEAERVKKPVADRVYLEAIGAGNIVINRG